MKSNLMSTIGIIICLFIGSALAAPPQLTLVKEVVGGEAAVTDWILTADGTDANDLSGAGFISGFVSPDTFLLSESAGQPGYTAGVWDCTGGGILDGQSLTLSVDEVVTCTIINTYEPPVVVFDTDFALPALPRSDGTGTPVCVDDVSGLLAAGCDAAIGTQGDKGDKGDQGIPGNLALQGKACPEAEYVRGFDAVGEIVCNTDNSGLSSVLSVDIVDGTITTVDLADNSITASKITTNAVGTNEVITSEVQQRVVGTCVDGQYLKGINEDGSVQCKKLPIGLNYTLDSTGDVGRYSDIAIGSDGLPIISYFDETNDDLKVYKCSNTSCSSGIVLTLDSTDDVGRYSDIAIGSDGLPIISYYDKTNYAQKIYKCSNSSCSAGSTRVLVSNLGSSDSGASIAISGDGNPIIVYVQNDILQLKAYKCSNVTCSAGNLSTLVVLGNCVAYRPTIAIRTDGSPWVICTAAAVPGEIRTYSCDDPSCLTGSSNSIFNGSNSITGWGYSIANGTDGVLMISYSQDGLLSVLPFPTIYPVNEFEEPGSVGRTSIAIGADDFPIISYYDRINGDLKALKCSNPSCSDGNAFTLDNVGELPPPNTYSSITIGSDDLPIISYYDTTNGDLKIHSCGNVDCRN